MKARGFRTHATPGCGSSVTEEMSSQKDRLVSRAQGIRPALPFAVVDERWADALGTAAVGQDLDGSHAICRALAAGPERWTAIEGGARVLVVA